MDEQWDPTVQHREMCVIGLPCCTSRKVTKYCKPALMEKIKVIKRKTRVKRKQKNNLHFHVSNDVFNPSLLGIFLTSSSATSQRIFCF